MQSDNGRKRLLLIAPRFSYRIAAYIQAANRANIRILIASDGKNSLVSELAAGLHVDFDDVDATVSIIATQHQLTPFDAIITSDDRTVAITAQIATTLGLICNPPHTAQMSRRKDLSRQTLALAGVAVPKHQKIDLTRQHDSEPDTGFPCVLKPLSLAASTGVIRADNQTQYDLACTQIRHIVAHLEDQEERQSALVEQYIDGVEVAVEGLVHNDEFQLLAIIDKPEPLTGPYFEESFYVTPSRLPQSTQEHIVATVREACRAMGIVTGPVHAELRIDQNDCWIIEVATRSIGGDCSKILQFMYEKSLEELVINNALGLDIQEQPSTVSGNKPDIAAGVMMIPTPRAGILRRVEGLLQAQAVEFIESVDIAVHPGHELITLPQGSSYLGFIFAKASTPDLVEKALRQAHECLRIVVAPLFVRAELP